MNIIDLKGELLTIINQIKSQNKSIGFVPTMGALHDGHLSLIKKAKSENDIVVVSIFVNPTQFNEKKDLENYPRTLEKDAQFIEDYCDIIFAPKTVNEVYPLDFELINYDFGGIENLQEGEHRPGHFKGMANVVSLLLKLTSPTKAYFGMKDFQQYLLVKKLVEIEQLDTEIIGCEIVRDRNGLARSSRNELLSEKAKEAASVINYSLNYIQKYHAFVSLKEMKIKVKSMLDGIMDTEYLLISDANSLEEITSFNNSKEIIVTYAGFLEGVRLIDNCLIS